ncbi:MAG: response regulator [Tepidisphaeraceae bacterium]
MIAGIPYADPPGLASGGPHLLLADDSPIERLALAHYLRSRGYKVDEVGDGQGALDFLQQRPVDLLLLDLQMPGVDGFDVLNYIDQHRRALPVIVLSGMPPDEIQDKIHSLRTRELPPLLIKPLDPEQVIEMVEMQLSGELPQAD